MMDEEKSGEHETGRIASPLYCSACMHGPAFYDPTPKIGDPCHYVMGLRGAPRCSGKLVCPRMLLHLRGWPCWRRVARDWTIFDRRVVARLRIVP